MSCVQLSEGGFQVVYPLGLWPRSSGVVNVNVNVNNLHLSKSYMDVASKLFTFTFTFTIARDMWQMEPAAYRPACRPCSWLRVSACLDLLHTCAPDRVYGEEAVQPGHF